MKYANCHPEKQHIAFGLCRTCYSREYYKTRPQYYIDKGRRNHADRRRNFAYHANDLARRMGYVGVVDWHTLEVDACAYCGAPCASWDHVLPLSHGGPNTNDNLVPCCRQCNTEKKARTPEQWLVGECVPHAKRGKAA